MFIKIKTSTKNLLQIGYSENDICVSQTSVTDAQGLEIPTYNFGSGNSCIECTDEDVWTRTQQLDDYVKDVPITGAIYNIKYYAVKRNAEEILYRQGSSHDPKQYVQSHFVGQDDTRDARILADEWTLIRTERDRLLTSTDWTQGNDTPLSDANTAKWTTYRGKLRTLPADQSSKTKYSQVTWPTKP